MEDAEETLEDVVEFGFPDSGWNESHGKGDDEVKGEIERGDDKGWMKITTLGEGNFARQKVSDPICKSQSARAGKVVWQIWEMI